LPAAMSAPTPVSSLVHSSTLVTAGVYLLVRFSSILTNSCVWLFLLGVFTILIAGIIANVDIDLKKVVAFSTLRQLGFIVSSYCCSLIIFCFFHLLTHALFKASLFMCSGVIIHSRDNRQDYRNRYNYSLSSRVLKISILICLLCLCGIPFTSGFFSKDLILDGGTISMFIFFFFFLGVILTFVYSLRFCFFLV
jgi:NADH-ubiquinone oxidoreductase chain 5